ncbi:MAG: MFS transporter [Candidatus Azobacteroides sp.]|nr:MFS transporter [Candidatus Azobacteroides sp.]
MMSNRKSWFWVPSLYFIEGLPYTLVINISVIMYTKLEISNAEMAFYTSWLYFPWVIKPLWSPFVDLLKSKRWWIIMTQFFFGACMAGLAFTIPTSFFFQSTLAFFWLLAFSSATHDIAADGFYMFGLKEEEQAFFIGIRTTAYRLAMIFGQGFLVVLAGYVEKTTNDIRLSWSVVFFISAFILIAGAIYHQFALPRPTSDVSDSEQSFSSIMAGFSRTFSDFFSKKGIGLALFFILTYRLSESQLLKLASPFLLDKRMDGGLGLTTEKFGLLYGTLGPCALILGGILGGIAISKNGLKKWLWPMALSLSLPHLAYVYLSSVLPESVYLIGFCVVLEQFGYGFGLTAFTMYLIRISEGKYKTSHYAFGTGFMALGMMLPGMVSGWIQGQIGYQMFFVWVMICSIPGFIATALVAKKLDS